MSLQTGGTVSPKLSKASYPSSASDRPVTLGVSAVLLVLAAVTYNTVLAFLNARGLTVSLPMVVLSEFLVLAAAAALILKSGVGRSDLPPLLLFGFFLLNAMMISLANGMLFVDMARNAAVIAIFLMIGSRVSERTVRRAFGAAALLVFAFLALESLSVREYAALLEPGRYFEQTRGISRFELDEIGLFANALGFDERFSILNIVGHRTSSLFLEQVSLANFASVLTVFLVSMWGRLPKWLRLAYPLLIALILVTNNSRTALALALAAPLIYFMAPIVPRLISFAIMPATLTAALIVALLAPESREDDLVGRLSLTIQTLRDMDVVALVGGRVALAETFADSGYTFVIYASTILGLLVLWFYFSTISAGSGAAQKRASLMAGLYLFANLTVSGTSIFSIKTAALLWLLVGYLRREDEEALRAPIIPEPPVRSAALQRRG